MSRRRLSDLQLLAEARLQGSIAELSRLARHRAAVRGDLDALANTASTERSNATSKPDPALWSASEAFETWVSIRATELNQNLAQLLLHEAEARAAAQADFGRSQALRSIMTRLRERQALENRRRG